MKTKQCDICGKEFKPRTSRHRVCTPECRKALNNREEKARYYSYPMCKVKGCKGRGCRAGGVCETHTRRMEKYGSYNKPFIKKYWMTKSGYKISNEKGHPIANKAGYVAEHRRIVYDDIGPGDHECEWCGKVLSWEHDDWHKRIVIDHLNEDKVDNRRENLVVSCNKCNRIRGGLVPFINDLKDEASLVKYIQAIRIAFEESRRSKQMQFPFYKETKLEKTAKGR